MRRSMRRRRTNSSDNGSFWLCFSDLMSTLVLVLVLIMFYSLYQHFDAMEEATARIISSEQALSDREAQLAAQDEELENSRMTLIQQQRELNAALEELQQAQLELEASQLSAEEKEELLAAMQARLDEQQAQLADQQTQMANQQAQMAQQEAQLEELVGVRAKIIVDLAGALNAANIEVNTDQNTGAIQLSSEVLFSVGQSELKLEGKQFLQRFIPVYMDVIMSEEYENSISEIIIEGHTDSTGTYIDNMALSQNRVRAVLEYILSDEFGYLTPEQKVALRKIATVNGRSYSDPILNANGVEDMDASRRVEFKFRLHDEAMIEQMRELLESYGNQ